MLVSNGDWMDWAGEAAGVVTALSFGDDAADDEDLASICGEFCGGVADTCFGLGLGLSIFVDDDDEDGFLVPDEDEDVFVLLLLLLLL